ncbi:MAG: hypothetical protein KJ709_03205 [Nanoarchaeota archaeon]|nr:hypothetical protein [Nanoarchaeota archaeon]
MGKAREFGMGVLRRGKRAAVHVANNSPRDLVNEGKEHVYRQAARVRTTADEGTGVTKGLAQLATGVVNVAGGLSDMVEKHGGLGTSARKVITAGYGHGKDAVGAARSSYGSGSQRYQSLRDAITVDGKIDAGKVGEYLKQQGPGAERLGNYLGGLVRTGGEMTVSDFSDHFPDPAELQAKHPGLGDNYKDPLTRDDVVKYEAFLAEVNAALKGSTTERFDGSRVADRIIRDITANVITDTVALNEMYAGKDELTLKKRKLLESML